MKRIALYLGLATALVASCSIQEENHETPQQDDVIFYASFEQPGEEGTKVYANEELLLRWNADDRVSIFNKITYNQEYKFLGETGDNAGGFNRVDNAEFVTGNPISHVVSVYPYQASTKITEEEVVTLALPSEQHYAENTFGLGANTMVSISEDNVLQYKNVGGYLRLSLYGEGVSVSSITLKGNSGEKLAGKATVSMPLDGVPTLALAGDATDEITLVCDTPVALGATAEESVDFWFVVPPMTFKKGFTVTVCSNGEEFAKSTEKALTIERNKLSKMSPIEVGLTMADNVIYYTSLDGKVVTPKQPNAFGAAIVSNEYLDGKGIITFDGPVTTIGDSAFSGCSNLLSISIPNSVTSIAHAAFSWCDGLESFKIPDSVTSIGSGAFSFCVEILSIDIPASVTRIDPNPFSHCYGLASITVHPGNPVYDSRDNCQAIIETQSNTLISGCTNTVIPDSVTSIGDFAFVGAGFETIEIPNSVTSIGVQSFSYTSLTSIVFPESIQTIGGWAIAFNPQLRSMTVLAITPPVLTDELYTDGVVNEFPIYVPFGSVNAYKSAPYWSNYSDRIFPIKQPDNIIYYTSSDENTVTPSSDDFGAAIVSNEYLNGTGTITFDGDVTTIGSGAFSMCVNLTSIALPPSVKRIGASAFEACRNLTDITLPEGLEVIDVVAFCDCPKLDGVVLPETLTRIGERAFDQCTNLKGMTIPPSVTDIGPGIFSYCDEFISVIVDAANPTYDSRGNCNAIIETASNTLIAGCRNTLIPDSVQIIGEETFYGCTGLSTIEIPGSVDCIDHEAFYDCRNLTSITLFAEVPPTIGEWVFDIDSHYPIFVPAGSVEAYQSAQYWCDFADRIQPIPE